MNFDDLFGPKPASVELRSTNRWEAIDELIGHLATGGGFKPEHKDAISTAVKRRESAMSTGIGFGIAMPHASTDLVSDFVVIVGRSRAGIEFDALDGQPVNRVALFLIPPGQFQRQVEVLAGLAKWLHRPDFRKDL